MRRETEIKQKALAEQVNQLDHDLEDFDPMAELENLNRQLSNNAGGDKNKRDFSLAERRDTWKMNFKMKNNNA